MVGQPGRAPRARTALSFRPPMVNGSALKAKGRRVNSRLTGVPPRSLPKADSHQGTRWRQAMRLAYDMLFARLGERADTIPHRYLVRWHA